MKNISKVLEDEKSASAGMSEQLISTKDQVTKLRANVDKVRKEKDALAYEVDRLKHDLLKNDEKKCSSHILTIKNLQDRVSTLEITNKEQLNALRKAHKNEVKELNRLLNMKDNDISDYKKQLKNITHKNYASIQTQTTSVTESVESQTEDHPDISYKITDALPPIFMMKLKKKNSRDRFYI